MRCHIPARVGVSGDEGHITLPVAPAIDELTKVHVTVCIVECAVPTRSSIASEQPSNQASEQSQAINKS